MRKPMPFLAAGILVLAAACTGGGDTTPSPATPTAATETTAASPTLSPGTSPAVSPAESPSPSPATRPATSPAVSPGTSPIGSPSGEAITVTGVDYAFQGVPTSVPAGTTFTFTNQGTEAHEMVVVRKNEGVTQTFQELLTLPDQEAFQLVAMVGATVAPPGEQAEAPVTVQDEGEYLMICFIPQGTTDLSEPGGTPGASPGLESPGHGEHSPGASIPVGPPHFVLGMLQEFQVTEAGSSPGPIASPGMHGMSPGTSPALSPAVSASP